MNRAQDKPKIERGMVLAAGLGTRMYPITQTIPKPLVRVRGTTLIDYALDALARVDVGQVAVNLHHHPDQIIEHLEAREHPKIAFSDERDELLDSGGGIKRALPLIGDAPFYLLNADSFWIEGTGSNLIRMAQQWDADCMDILLLVSDMVNAVGFDSKGDFMMEPDGQLHRRKESSVAPFAYAGAAILNPKIFDDAPEGPFSLNRLFDRALDQERMFGIRLDGLWLHVGTPEAIREAEEAIATSAA